jgi:hypothetical protein
MCVKLVFTDQFTQKPKLVRKGGEFIYTSILLTCRSLGRKCGIGVSFIFLFFINKSRLPEFELKTSRFDTMLNYYAPTSSPKSLSWWGKVGNSFTLQQCECHKECPCSLDLSLQH